MQGEGVREGISRLLQWEGGWFSRFKGQIVHGRLFVPCRRASHLAVSPFAMSAMRRLLIEGPSAIPSRSVGVFVGSRPGLGLVMVDGVLRGGVTYRPRAVGKSSFSAGCLGGSVVVSLRAYQTVWHLRSGGLSRYRARLDFVVPCSDHSQAPLPNWGGGHPRVCDGYVIILLRLHSSVQARVPSGEGEWDTPGVDWVFRSYLST